MGTSGWFSIALIAIGAFTVLRAARSAAEAEARMRSGEDRYFEERRALEAYPQQRDPAKIRRGGWFMIAAGFGLMMLDVLIVS
tara:strand:+ start:147 stop:395 length:249 start_codon:yes stop_codon:yes gene_type:complete